MAPTGSLWYLESLKYDQHVHYRLPARLISDADDLIVLRAETGAQGWHSVRGAWTLQRHSYYLIWPDQGYNIFLNYTPDGRFTHYYCNAALPPSIDRARQYIAYIDLDLDVLIEPDGRFRVLDTDEFRHHAVVYQYPRHIKQAAGLAVLDIILRLRARQWPFERVPDPPLAPPNGAMTPPGDPAGDPA